MGSFTFCSYLMYLFVFMHEIRQVVHVMQSFPTHPTGTSGISDCFEASGNSDPIMGDQSQSHLSYDFFLRIHKCQIYLKTQSKSLCTV